MYIPANVAYCFCAVYLAMSGSIFHCDPKKGKRTLKPVRVEEIVP